MKTVFSFRNENKSGIAVAFLQAILLIQVLLVVYVLLDQCRIFFTKQRKQRPAAYIGV